MKKVILLLCIYAFSSALFAQKRDYSTIKFKSKLREYTKTIPKTKENHIDRALFEELVNLLANDKFTPKEKVDFTNKLWLANSNPKKFDFVYKDFSLNTIKNWGVKIKFEDPNFEPNPYLAKWTVTGDEFLYWQWATSEILIYLKLMGYGEESKNVQKSLNNFLHLEKYKVTYPRKEEHPHDYLARVNAQLKSKGLTVLLYDNHYDFTVCKTADKERVQELLAKLKWSFIEP